MLIDAARRSLDLLGSRRRWKWLLLPSLAIAVAALESLGAALVFALVGMVTLTGSGEAPVLPLLGDLEDLFPAVSVEVLQFATATSIVAFFACRSCVVILQQYVQSRVVQNAGAEVATRLVHGYLARPYLFHTQRSSAVLIRNAFESATRLANHVMMPLVTIMAETVLVVVLGVALLILSPVATLLAAAGLLPAVWLLQRVVQPRLKEMGRGAQEASAESLACLRQAFGGFREIRLLRQERHFATLFEEERGRYARYEYLRDALAALPRALIETALVSVIVIIFALSLIGGAAIDAAAATLGVFAYVGLRLQPSLQRIVQSLNQIRFGTPVLDDLYSDSATFISADVKWRLTDDDGSHEGQNSRPHMRHSLALRNVTFSYSQGNPPVLKDVSFTMRRGEFIGICGPTGGGKSTLVDLLVGLLVPDEGSVLVDEMPLRGREKWWYEQLGVVSQDPFLLDGTIRENILFGRNDECVAEEEVLAAVSQAQMDEFVAMLPEGLDTPVGEDGIRLSGGQRQRVAIARALCRRPSVLVFDEGTSALDAVTEAALVDSLEQLQAGRTLIAVAHRISTVQTADRILVVDAGQITAAGSYSDLLRSSKLFRSLAK